MSLLKSFAWSTHSEYFTLVCVCAFFFYFSKFIGISNSELVFAICYLKCSVKIALVQLQVDMKYRNAIKESNRCIHLLTLLPICRSTKRQPANCSYVLFLFVLNSINFFFDYAAGISFEWGFHQNSVNVPIGATSSAKCVVFFHLAMKLEIFEIKFHQKKQEAQLAGDRVQLSSGDHHHHRSSMCFSIEITNRPQSKTTTKLYQM